MTEPLLLACGRCRHSVDAHDSYGCPDCACLLPPAAAEAAAYDNDPPDPPAPEASRLFTVAELDALHDESGLGAMWRRSPARATAAAAFDDAVPLERVDGVWCWPESATTV